MCSDFFARAASASGQAQVARWAPCRNESKIGRQRVRRSRSQKFDLFGEVTNRAVHLNEMRPGGWVWVQLHLIFYQVGMGIYFVNTRKKNRVLGMGMGTYGICRRSSQAR